MTRGRPLVLFLLLAALVLALPASSALAQSAGDNQYQDPLGGLGGGSGNSGGGSSKPSTPAQPAQSSGGNSSSASPSQAPKSTRSVPLARTGFDARIPAIAGLLLLSGGILLLRPRRSRA